MHVLAMYLAYELNQSRIDESVERRLALQLASAPSIRERLASGLRQLVGASDEPLAVIPKLEGYPYRG